jgi:hypothetical protein
MKKFYLLAVLVTALYPFAGRSQVQGGVIGGLGLASYSLTASTGGYYGTTTYSSSAILSYHLGGLLDIPIDEHFLIQPQLLFSLKGGEDQNNLQSLEHEIEIPILVEYKFKLGIGQLYGGLGPHFGIGLSIKQKQDGNSQSLEFGSGANQFKRVDVGGTFTAGYLLDGGLFGALKISPGFSNLLNAGGTLHFFNIGFSVGYMFPGGK